MIDRRTAGGGDVLRMQEACFGWCKSMDDVKPCEGEIDDDLKRMNRI